MNAIMLNVPKLKKLDWEKIRKSLNGFQLDEEFITNIVFHSELKKSILFEEYKKHIGEQRTRWLEEELENNEESINVIITKGKTIIASKSFYQNCFDGTFEEVATSINSTNFLMEHKVVVNEEYRRSGFGTKLTVELNRILLTSGIAYIVGDTNNPDALRIYQRAGAKVFAVFGEYKRYFYKEDNIST